MDTDQTDHSITDHSMKEVLDGLFTLLETLETQNAAVLEFLKDQGIATDEKLAPYLVRAGSASSVKWRAARVRMAYLLAPAPKKATDQREQPVENETQRKTAEPKQAVSKDVGAKQEAGPRDASASDASHQDAATAEPVAKVSDRAGTQETGRKTQPSKTDAPGSAAVSGGDGVDADPEPSAKGSHPVAKSKAATAGRADENDEAHKSKSPDAPSPSKK